MSLHEEPRSVPSHRNAGRTHAAILAAYTMVVAALAPMINACATKDDPRTPAAPQAAPTSAQPDPESPDFVDPNKNHTFFMNASPGSATSFTVQVKLNKGGASDGFTIVVESQALNDDADPSKGVKNLVRSSDIKGVFPSPEVFSGIRRSVAVDPNIRITITDKKNGTVIANALSVKIRDDGKGVGIGFESAQTVQ